MKMLIGWVLAALVIAFAGVALAGTLEPPDSAIDSGTGDPKPTMKSLDSIPSTWDRILPADDGPDPCHSSRFTCVMNDEAVRDNETGLVWRRSLKEFDGTTLSVRWDRAVTGCLGDNTGNRFGWRLSKIEELTSLFEPATKSLPSGHPFNIDLTDGHILWSISNAARTSSHTSAPRFILLRIFDGGFRFEVNVSTAEKSPFGLYTQLEVWCVRGGSGVNPDSVLD